MSGIGVISSSTAIRVIQPVHRSGSSDQSYRDQTGAPRQAYATAGAKPTGKPQTGDYTPFFAQMASHDDASTSSAQGAVAYLVARDRMRDLPVGFLIAKAV
jgi:hypothetical protein